MSASQTGSTITGSGTHWVREPMDIHVSNGMPSSSVDLFLQLLNHYHHTMHSLVCAVTPLPYALGLAFFLLWMWISLLIWRMLGRCITWLDRLLFPATLRALPHPAPLVHVDDIDRQAARGRMIGRQLSMIR